MNTHIHHSFLGLVEDLLENRDPEAVQDRLEELKGIVAPLPPARRSRYVRLLQEVSKSSALDELENQAISPVSQAAFQSLEELEAQAARLPLLFLDEEPPGKPTGGEELVTISARIGSADAPETIREATDILLNTCRTQDGLFDQMLYCSWGRKLMEEKILTEEQGCHPIPALSLWDSLRRAPCEALAISLL